MNKDCKTLRKHIELPKEVKFALSVLRENKIEAYIVGGAIRDALLNKKPHDFDIAAGATPNKIMSLFPGYCISKAGLKHGTVRVIIHKNPVEITSFRIEGAYLDHRHPTKVDFVSSPYIDSLRRDFTINAFYYYNDVVYDFHNGLEDLNNGLIRAIGNPKERFEEDALRILRAIRFSVQFNYEIEENTKKAMIECSNELEDISEERIEEEILKTACFSSFLKCINHNKEVFSLIFPNLETCMKNFDIGGSISPYINLSLLFYSLDMGINHVEALLKKLKFSNDNIKAILAFLAIDNSIELRELLNKKKLLKTLMNTDPLTPELVIEYIKLRDEIEKKDISMYGEVIKLYNADDIKNIPTNIKELKVTGNDLLRIGFKKGPIYTKVLNDLLKEVNSLNVENKRKDELAWLKAKFIELNR